MECVEKTERSIKARFTDQRRPTSITLEVSECICRDQPRHTAYLFTIKPVQSTLKKEGRRYSLPVVCINIMEERVKMDRPTGGTGYSMRSQWPQRHLGRHNFQVSSLVKAT